MFKVIKQIDINIPNDLFQIRHDVYPGPNTRGSCLKLVVHNPHYNMVRNSIRLVQLWNTLPNTVVGAQSVAVFKKNLDLHVLNHTNLTFS